MDRRFLLLWLSLLSFVAGAAQKTDTDSTAANKWRVNTTAAGIFFPGEAFLMGIATADKGKLHLVGRYNYEDLNTVSLFAGYNFTGGKQLQYRITPMLGLVAGNTNGIAPGFEAQLNWGKFRFYTEDEYVFAFNEQATSFFYSWSEVTFAPKDWFWLGVSWQRLRPYQTDQILEKGFVAGFAFHRFMVQGYYFNPGSNKDFGIVTLTASF